MLSIPRIKELFEAPEMADQEAEEIRDALAAFARKVLDQWIYQTNNSTYGFYRKKKAGRDSQYSRDN